MMSHHRCVAAALAAACAFTAARAAEAPVTVAEDQATFTLANGVVAAKVSKRSGDLVSLTYQGLELLGGGSGHAYAYWSHAPGRGESGVYTYSVFDHKPEYPATSVGEARFAAKLNGAVFDFMTIDAKRRKVMPRPGACDQ
jgi:hypothetical protein